MPPIESDLAHYRTLPQSPDLGRLREQAKSLKMRCASGDPDAIAFVNFHRKQTHAAVKLADAQFALARSYGFRSWVRLKAFVEAQAHTPAQRGEQLLNTLFMDKLWLLEELYERRESLPSSDFFVAAALGNVAVVESMLAADPAWATRMGGPMKTQAITYAAYGHFAHVDETYPARQQHIVRLLLAHGADPNSSVQAESRGKAGDGRLSSLYGCCRAPGNPEVAKILLDAGATTNDGESLYHASELPDTRCLELLFAAGVPKADQEYCIRRALDYDSPRAVSIYLKHGTNPNHLHWALFRIRSLPVIELLVEHGADLNARCPEHWLLKRIEGLTPVQIAERNGTPSTVAYLLAKGATDNRTPSDFLIGACTRDDEDVVRAILRAHPNVVQTLDTKDHSNVSTFARAGRLKTVQLMLDAGFNIEARADDLDATPILYAASNGDVAMLDLLIARGARLDVKHKYDGSPLDTAVFCAAHPNPQGDYVTTVQHLIEAGEKVQEEFLQWALANDLEEIAVVLKAHGAAL